MAQMSVQSDEVPNIIVKLCVKWQCSSYNKRHGLHAAYIATSCILEEENKRQKKEMLCHLSILCRLDVGCAQFHSVQWPLDAQVWP